MEQYLIKIIRSSGFAPLKVYKVELDGFQAGKLGSKSELNIPTTVGYHVLSFIWGGKTEKVIQLNISEEQHFTIINVKLNAWSGKIELELEKLSQAAAADSSSRVFEKNMLSVKHKPQSKTKKILLISIIVLYVLISFSKCLNETDDKPTNTNTSNTNTTNTQVEMTNEEKAQLEIKKSTEAFSKGNYQKALEICANIAEQYPDTETASNINNYINEQYAQFPSFTAKEIMAKYEANIVNADKEYTDKVMIVSGTVSKIDKTNHDSNLCVLLKSDLLLRAVQLNFNESQTDSVAALKEGNSVKVIGKCTGKSGKYFLVFDGENVMIENCILIQ